MARPSRECFWVPSLRHLVSWLLLLMASAHSDIYFPSELEELRLHESARKCLARGQVLWRSGGGCWDLLSTGPCDWWSQQDQEEYWLVLEAESQEVPVGECQRRACPGENLFQWEGRCVNSSEEEGLCPNTTVLSADPWGGATVCSCPEAYLWLATQRKCFPLSSSPPPDPVCPEGLVLQEDPVQPFLREKEPGPGLLLLQGSCQGLDIRQVVTAPLFQCQVRDPAGGCRQPASIRWDGPDAKDKLQRLFQNISKKDTKP